MRGGGAAYIMGGITRLAEPNQAKVIAVAQPGFTTLASHGGKRIAVGSSESCKFNAAGLLFGGFGLYYEGAGICGECAPVVLGNECLNATNFSAAVADWKAYAALPTTALQ